MRQINFVFIAVSIACVATACGNANDTKSTGTTFWDLGAQFNPHDLGAQNGDAGAGGPLFPLTLTPLTAPQTDTANISLYFQVTDAHGLGVPNLMTSQFTYLEDSMTVDPTESHFTVTPLSASTLTIPTVLVLDVSGSVSGKLSDIQAAATAIVNGMLPEQQMAIMVFADKPQVLQNLTADKSLLMTAVNNIATADVGVSTNLYGAAISAVGMWMDGFENDPSMTQLTAGLAIVITDGTDDAAVNTLQDFVTARANKRVITVGFGSSIDVSVLKEMQTAGFIQETSYATLVGDIATVTQTIETLAHSIYSANYCSPKRAGTHDLLFTVTGNPEADIDATCTPATFSSQAPATCASLGDQTHTQVCTEAPTCCPFDAPYACPTTSVCYFTAADAQAACGKSCILCGGTGDPSTVNTGLQSGPAIHVSFTATNYATQQCPAFWGTNCKALQSCCPSVVPTSEESSCESALTTAMGDESQCTTQLASFCPTLMANCMALQSCCASYASGSTAQSDCQQTLFQAHGSESTCTTTNSEYCPSPSPMPNCAALKDCCDGLGQYGQASCIQAMVSDGSSHTITPAETQCATTMSQYCPTGTNCMALQKCCDKFGQQEQTQCYGTLTSDDSSGSMVFSESECMSSMSTYCPTTTNCMALQTCCAAKPTTPPSGSSDTTRDQCEANLVQARNNDSQCMTYLTQNGC